MDYKAIVRDDLKRLNDMRHSVRSLRNRAQLERARAASLSSCGADVRVQGGRPGDAILSAVATADISDRQADYIAAQIDELNNALLALPQDQRDIITCMLVEGLSADDAGERVHLERRSVYYKLDEGITALARLLWGVVQS